MNNVVYVLGTEIKLRAEIKISYFSNYQGGDTEILKFNPSANNTWEVFAQMTAKAGSKLEVSTINCSLGKSSI